MTTDKRKRPNKHELSLKDKENLYKNYIGLIKTIVLKHVFKSHTLSFKDLVNAAYIGLIRAAELFDEDKKTKFSTYAVPHMERFVHIAIQKEDKSIHISRHITEKIDKYINVVEKLKTKLDREPTVQEIMDEMNISKYYVKQIKRVLGTPIQILSLDAPVEGIKNSTLKDLIASKKETFCREELIFEESLDELLKKYLNPEEIKIINLRFGRYDDNPLSFREISKKIGKSHEKVRKVYLKTIEKLKRALKV